MSFKQVLATISLTLLAAASHAQAAPDAMIKQVSTEVIDTVKNDKAIQAGDVGRILALVDTKVMPHVNFQRMTASAVGRHWRTATPEQQKRLQDEFKILIVRTYAGALTQVKEQNRAVEAAARRRRRHRSRRPHRGQGQGRPDPARLPPREERHRAGRSTTSTCSACGWSNSTGPASRRRSAAAASTA